MADTTLKSHSLPASVDADAGSEKPEPIATGIENIDIEANQTLETAHQAEQELTVRQALVRHPALVWWCFYWAMAGVTWGFDSQINGSVIAVPSFRLAFGYVENGQIVLPAKWQTAFNTVSSAGQFVSCFFCSWVADRIGRRGAMLTGLLLLTGGILGEMFTTVPGGFVAVKLILGFGLGFLLTLSPLATSELAPVVLRGMATAGVNLGIAIGQLLSSAVIKGFGDRTDTWAFRGPFAMQLFFAIFLYAGLPFAPETPWHLVRRGKLDLARRSLQRLYGKDTDVSAKLGSIEWTVQHEEQEAPSKESSWMQCFRGTDAIRTSISMCVFICQHFAGIVFVLGYSTYFFELAGLPISQSFNLGVGVTACGVLGNICSWFVVNTLGRRPVFLTGMVALFSLLLLIGIMDVVPASGTHWVQSAATVVYNFVYFGTIGSMAFTILGEVSSAALRARTAALATATQSVMGILMNFICPYMVNPDEANLKGKVGFVFGGLCAVAAVWSFFYVPELKGRSVDEIDRLFALRVTPRKMGKYVLS